VEKGGRERIIDVGMLNRFSSPPPTTSPWAGLKFNAIPQLHIYHPDYGQTTASPDFQALFPQPNSSDYSYLQ